MIIILRDQSLDSELESGAHLTLILVAIGLAFLFTATAVIFYLFPVCRVVRRTLFPQPVNDDGQVQRSINTKQAFRPRMTSTPLRQMLALPQSLNQPCRQPKLSTIPTQGAPTFFATNMPRYPAPSTYKTNSSYNGRSPGFFNHRTSPPIQTQMHNYYHTHLARSLQPPPPPPPHVPIAHFGIVSPHIAGWMRVADDVVGRHPFAKPLCDRLPSQAEIALVSRHVHIPWAHDAGPLQPTPGKVSGDTQKRIGYFEPNAIAESKRVRFERTKYY